MIRSLEDWRMIWSSKNGHCVKLPFPTKNSFQTHWDFCIPNTNASGGCYKTSRCNESHHLWHQTGADKAARKSTRSSNCERNFHKLHYPSNHPCGSCCKSYHSQTKASDNHDRRIGCPDPSGESSPWAVYVASKPSKAPP